MTQNILSNSGHEAPSLVDARGGPEGGSYSYAKLAGISCNAATPATTSVANVKENIKLRYPRMHELPEFNDIHAGTEPIALVGAGPSLTHTLAELREFKGPVVACGGPYDYLVEDGIIPEYCVICDPDPIVVNYITKANRKTLFLLSTAVDPLVVSKLKGFNIAFWHCHSEDNEKGIREFEEPYQAIGGGCTVGLRSLSIAIIMGYSNIHLFGFDSCMDGDKHHVYEFSDETKEHIGKLHRIRIGFGTPGDRSYLVAGYQLAQADQFREFYTNFGKYFTPTFHGTGLLPDVFEAIQRRAKETKASDLIETVGVTL